jgi:hypothetical protein
MHDYGNPAVSWTHVARLRFCRLPSDSTNLAIGWLKNLRYAKSEDDGAEILSDSTKKAAKHRAEASLATDSSLRA